MCAHLRQWLFVSVTLVLRGPHGTYMASSLLHGPVCCPPRLSHTGQSASPSPQTVPLGQALVVFVPDTGAIESSKINLQVGLLIEPSLSRTSKSPEVQWGPIPCLLPNNFSPKESPTLFFLSFSFLFSRDRVSMWPKLVSSSLNY